MCAFLRAVSKISINYLSCYCFLLPRFQDRIPFAVVGSNTVLEVNGKRVRARVYPWGVAEGKLVLLLTKQQQQQAL